MTKQVTRKAPFCMYVVWHPLCEDGERLARNVYNWFHAPSAELHRAGLGIPVYYRWKSAPGEPVPAPIKGEQAQLNVVVVLVDENMVADPTWRRYLDECQKQENTRLFPVPLHRSAYQLPAVNALNFLRVDGRCSADPETRFRVRTEALLRQLTQVCARLLQSALKNSETQNDEAGEPLTIFLSHAKSDGVEIAEALRNKILNYGQLQAFFDESDLPIGFEFGTRLETAVESGAAMFSIVTDSYAGRPWCRSEFSLARKPRRERDRKNCWYVIPTLLVAAQAEQITRSICEVGNIPSVRWGNGREDKLLDSLLLEVLLNSYHRLNAAKVPVQSGRQVISWVPDPISTMLLVREIDEVSEIVYPGYGLSAGERSLMKSLLPKELSLLTFEEAWQKCPT